MEAAMALLRQVVEDVRAQRRGGIELIWLAERALTVKVLDRKVDEFALADSSGLGVRVVHDGRIGYGYTEKLELASIKGAVEMARENASVAPRDDAALALTGLAPPSVGPNLHLFTHELERVTVDQKIACAELLESTAREYDSRIVNVPHAEYSDGAVHVTVLSSSGTEGNYKANGAGLMVGVIANEADDTKSPSKVRYSKNFSDLSPETLASEVASEGVARLGARTPPSGSVSVVLTNEMARDLLGAFSGMFSAKRVQKRLSLLRGRLGDQVAARHVRLVDNALLDGGYASRPFDDEGTPSQRTVLVEGGVLRSFLYDRYTAAKEGVNSTGNALRPSIRSSIEVMPTNIYIEPGTESCSGLMQTAGKGILVVELHGLHSGASPISGDFSLGAQGYAFEHGRVQHPVHQFTVAGNFLEVLRHIALVGSDLEFGPPYGRVSVGAPSLLIEALSVSAA